jgi:F420-dependent methylenetetrahydromethanopterin dehydrogenase
MTDNTEYDVQALMGPTPISPQEIKEMLDEGWIPAFILCDSPNHRYITYFYKPMSPIIRATKIPEGEVRQ